MAATKNGTEHENRQLACRGIRGATTVDDNTADAIREATQELLTKLIEANDLKQEDITSVFFTATADLNADYPAVTARQMGWRDVALMCGQEMAVPHSLKKCIRVLIHWNTTRRNDEIHHVYIRGAVTLRPDLAFTFKPEKQES